jgi:hypothetical protein
VAGGGGVGGGTGACRGRARRRRREVGAWGWGIRRAVEWWEVVFAKAFRGVFAKQHQSLLRVEINFSVRTYLQTMWTGLLCVLNTWADLRFLANRRAFRKTTKHSTGRHVPRERGESSKEGELLRKEMYQGDLPGSFPLLTPARIFFAVPFLESLNNLHPLLLHGWMDGHFILSVFTTVVL